MTDLQKACGVAIVLWLAVHGAMAIVLADRSQAPILSVFALVLCVAVSALVTASAMRADDSPLPDWQAWLFAASVVVIGGLVTPFLAAEDLRSYANWWISPVGIIIAALALRRHPIPAASAAAGACAVIAAAVIRKTSPMGDIDLLTIALLWLPPPLWWTGGCAARYLLDRTDEAVARFSVAEAGARLRAAEGFARTQRADEHRAELAENAVPVLIRLSRGELKHDSTLREVSRQLEARLRDDLRGKALLDGTVRRAAADARGRGAIISIVDDSEVLERSGLLEKVRPLIAAALNSMSRGNLTIRLRPDGESVTVAIDGHGVDTSKMSEALQRSSHAEALATHVDHSADDLWAEVSLRSID